MPKRSRSRKYATKRQVKRRMMAAPAKPISVTDSFPPRINAKFVYGGDIRLNSGVLSLVSNVFRGNSIFDPDWTGIGSQPLGHDQYAALYLRYRVIASKFEVWFAANTTEVVNSICILPSNDSASILWPEATQMPGAKIAMTTGRTGNSTGYLSQYVTAAQMKGDNKLATDKDMEATFGSNPNIAWFWHLIVQSPGATAPDMRCNVRITYYLSLIHI